MEYTNPELPEGINTTKSSPLKEFLLLTTGVVVLGFIVVYSLIFIVDNFADKIPFSYEEKLPINRFLDEKDAVKLPDYLQQVSAKVIANAGLPPDMSIQVHYVNSDVVNAYATLGGHIVLFRGLLEKLKYEDELAMVIAHEVAHVKHRHPILSTSHGVVIGLVFSVISHSSGDGVVDNLLGKTGMISMMKYSRDFEYQADEDAINNLILSYGNTDGAIELFKLFETERGEGLNFEFLNTHPMTQNRINKVGILSQSQKLDPAVMMTPVPETFKAWLKAQKVISDKKANSK